MEASEDIWSIVLRGGPLDAKQLLRALIAQGEEIKFDARSRMLCRDTLAALEGHWGTDSLRHRLISSNALELLETARTAPDEGSFRTTRERLIDATDVDQVFEMLQEMGTSVNAPNAITVGGSYSLILQGLLMGNAAEAEMVDERLPEGWRERLRPLGRFGNSWVSVVDPLDVLMGKLFSKRNKEFDDLRAAWRLIDRASFRDLLSRSTPAFRDDAELLKSAKHNWYVLTGERDLPPVPGV